MFIMKWIQRKPKQKILSTDSPTEMIAKIRGIDDVNKFLSPTSDELHNPYSMKNIEEVANKIIKAIKNNLKIVVSYDADADGLTSTSMFIRYLKNYTDKVDYIYNERNHGHGINEQTRLDFVADKDYDEDGEITNVDKASRYKLNQQNIKKISEADLLIIIDSSSNDVDACEKIVKDYNTDIIIIDHHAIEKDNPYALIVNPQLKDCEYPNKHLSGAGVAFKVMEVMEDTLNEVDIWYYNDLVAVGMYADVMRTDIPENRYLIMNGLRNINNVGLTRILKGAKADFFRLNGDSIGFAIAPLLNGVCRMDNIILAIEILLEDDDNICKKLRLKMQKINDNRKVIQKGIVEQYVTKVDASNKILMVFDEQSSKGFNGIVAQQLSDLYKRPVMVGRIHNGRASGSFRSFNGFKLKSFLQGFDNMDAMGHEGAGGFDIEIDQLDNLGEYINKLMPDLDDEEPTVLYDFEINSEQVEEYIRLVEKFNHVVGSGFPKIIVRVNGITVEEPKCIGKTEETVKISTYDSMELIKFRVDKDYASELGHFDTIDVVGELKMNEFYNFGLKKKIITPQVMISDYKTS